MCQLLVFLRAPPLCFVRSECLTKKSAPPFFLCCWVSGRCQKRPMMQEEGRYKWLTMWITLNVNWYNNSLGGPRVYLSGRTIDHTSYPCSVIPLCLTWYYSTSLLFKHFIVHYLFKNIRSFFTAYQKFNILILIEINVLILLSDPTPFLQYPHNRLGPPVLNSHPTIGLQIKPWQRDIV